jgi:hypothetical protein
MIVRKRWHAEQAAALSGLRLVVGRVIGPTFVMHMDAAVHMFVDLGMLMGARMSMRVIEAMRTRFAVQKDQHRPWREDAEAVEQCERRCSFETRLSCKRG